MIWRKIANIILNNKIKWLIFIGIVWVVMTYCATKIQLAYELPKILPTSDLHSVEYEKFKARFGEDGNVMILGIESDKIYQKAVFDQWYLLTENLKKVDGIKNVMSAANLSKLAVNDSSKNMEVRPILPHMAQNQSEVDSTWATIKRLRFYEGFVYSSAGSATLMMLTFDPKKLNSKNRRDIVDDVQRLGSSFSASTGIEMHYTGLPFVRTNFSSKVISEMGLFMVLAFVVTILILYLFFRMLRPVIYSAVLIIISVAVSLALIHLFGYKITILTGLIPPIIIVVSIPNTIFLINKYQEEFLKHQNQHLAIATSIEKIGNTTFLANITTSIGFFVFYFTSSPLLLEFGLVAAICIMCTWALFLILTPILLSYSPAPSSKHIKHLSNPLINGFLAKVDHWVKFNRSKLYWGVVGLLLVSFIGIYQVRVNGFVVDDLPENDPVYKDLKWIESRFKGIVPIEVMVDTHMPDGVFNPMVLNKIKAVQKEFAKQEVFTKPVSVVEAIKFVYQEYRGGQPKYYQLPGALELQKLGAFAGGAKGKTGLFSSFVDSSRSLTRISFQMEDLGTAKVNPLVDQLQGKIDTIFNYEDGQILPENQRVTAKITGNGFVFTKGNNYLLGNLKESTLLAIFLVSLVMAMIFFKLRNLEYTLRMIYIAAIPSIIPLLITGGLMGYFGIDLKPSTILIFSIAFGISSDGTIYFLTKYKEEREQNKLSVSEAVTETIKNTGISMFYTAIILFAGFFIFTASSFKGTFYMGLLVSLTLLLGMIANLVLLPAFLQSLDKRGKI